MKKKLLKMAFLVLAAGGSQAQPNRFISEVFPSSSVIQNVTYAQNMTWYFVQSPPPVLIPLSMDVYTPAGAPDTMTMRPLVVYLHTGSFLPYPHGGATGKRTDSCTVEMCRQFARRGYVAASIDYRLGWNPSSLDQDERTGSIMQAFYRGIQDIKSCVRYFKATAASGNMYGIDTTKIILCGQGTGGYLALAYVSLDDPAEISLAKFISSTTNASPPYYFQAGFSYVNPSRLGDFDGYGGDSLNNYSNNTPGHTGDVQFSVNIGGAIPDSSWMAAGDVPMVSFHLPLDPFAPYGHGPVYVPPPVSLFVVDVDGSEVVARRANALGNNNFMYTIPATPYTLRADAINNGSKGLFPLVTSSPLLSAPWEWWDSATVVNAAVAAGYPLSTAISIHLSSLSTNPTMSKAQALLYIDTIQNYANWMIAYRLGLVTGLEEHSLYSKSVAVYPNPATESITVATIGIPDKMNKVTIADATGRIVFHEDLSAGTLSIPVGNLSPGLYLVKVCLDQGEIVKKLSIR